MQTDGAKDDFERIKKADIPTVWFLFLEKFKKNYIFSFILPIFLFLFFCWLSGVSHTLQPLFVFMVIYFAICGFFWQNAVGTYLRNFAVKAGFYYQDSDDINSVDGTIFDFGSDRSITKIIFGKYFEKDTRLFIFSTTVGSGKSRQTYMYSVLEISFDAVLPNILLNNKKNWISSSQWPLVFPDNEAKLNLEGDFQKYFNLYVAKEYEIEALQIFTPEIMQMFIEQSDDISVEMFKNKVYLYYPHEITKKEQLVLIYGLAKEIILRLGAKFSLIKNDVQDMEKYAKLT